MSDSSGHECGGVRSIPWSSSGTYLHGADWSSEEDPVFIGDRGVADLWIWNWQDEIQLCAWKGFLDDSECGEAICY